MIAVNTVLVRVVMDSMNTIEVRVPEHEVKLLQAVHDEAEPVADTDEVRDLSIEESNEYSRLVMKYGTKAVESAYGLSADNKLKGLIEKKPKAKKQDEQDKEKAV
jgi:hypothetical protein